MIRPMITPMLWLLWEGIGLCFAVSVLQQPRQRRAWWIAALNLLPIVTCIIVFSWIIRIKHFVLEP